MKFNDQQLSEILKQVQVPSDLKDQLRTISGQAAELQVEAKVTGNLLKSKFGSRRVLGWLSLATAAVVLFTLIWTNPWEASKDSQMGTLTANHEALDVSHDRLLASDMEPVDRQTYTDSLTMVALQSEIDDIEKELELIRPSTSNANAHLDADEYTSLVIATASQTAILSGVSIEYLRGDLEESIQRFPETRGSTIAAQLLASAGGQH